MLTINKSNFTAILFCLLFYANAPADSLLTAISTRLSKAKVTYGQFQQEKRLKFLTKPLMSSGEFIYYQEKGVLWKTLTPVVSAVLINGDKLVSETGEQAVPPAFGRIFKTLLSGEFNHLADDFAISGTNQGTSWQLQLIPKDDLLKKVISDVQLQGSTDIESWEFHESGGNQSRIIFANIHHDDHLSSGQLADFEKLSP